MTAKDSVGSGQAAIPEGFEEMPTGLGFGDNLRPFYRRRQGDQVSFGLRVDQQHLNLMGICHGGALMTLADIAAATSIHAKCDRPLALPTINLSFDFISPGRAGHWIETRADHVEVKRRFGFCSGVIVDGDQPVLRYSGTFYFPDQPLKGVAEQDRVRLALLGGGDGAGI